MLPLRLSSTISINVFKEIWTAHISPRSIGTSPRGQTLKFHTLNVATLTLGS